MPPEDGEHQRSFADRLSTVEARVSVNTVRIASIERDLERHKEDQTREYERWARADDAILTKFDALRSEIGKVRDAVNAATARAGTVPLATIVQIASIIGALAAVVGATGWFVAGGK